MHRYKNCFALTSLIVLVSCLGAAAAEPTATLIDQTARIEPDGHARLVLQVDGLDDQQKQDKNLLQNVKDLDVPAVPEIQYIKPSVEEILPAGVTARTFRIVFDVKGAPVAYNQKRAFVFDLNGKSMKLDYMLTNLSLSKFSWTVKAPSSIAIDPGQSIPISISVGPVPATGVVLINPYLVEKTSKSLIAPEGLRLCTAPATSCKETKIDLPANSAAQLWMQNAVGIGQYDGTITIASNEKPEGDTITLAVYLTTVGRQILGFVAILVGVLLAWGVTVYGRNRVNLNQMLLPAALLRERISALKPILKAPPGIKTGNVDSAIASLEGRLEPAKLTAFGLPSTFPAPWNPSTTNDTERYRLELQGIADWVVVLEAIVRDGFKQIWPKWQVSGAQNQVIEDATKALDEIVTNTAAAPPIDSVRLQIRTQIDKVNTAHNIAPVGGAAPPPLSYERLIVQVMQISAIAWALVIVATTVVGTLALVLTNSFGSAVDILTCFAWGLGVPIGSQAMTASLGSVGTSMGISVTKT